MNTTEEGKRRAHRVRWARAGEGWGGAPRAHYLTAVEYPNRYDNAVPVGKPACPQRATLLVSGPIVEGSLDDLAAVGWEPCNWCRQTWEREQGTE